MPDADPLNLAAANRVAQRVEGITDQAEDVPNPDLFEHADQDVCHHLSHLSLLRCCDRRHPCGVPKIDFAQNRGAGFISGRRRVVSENVVAIFCRLVAGEARFVQPNSSPNLPFVKSAKPQHGEANA
jgi:hypothetical protein